MIRSGLRGWSKGWYLIEGSVVIISRLTIEWLSTLVSHSATFSTVFDIGICCHYLSSLD